MSKETVQTLLKIAADAGCEVLSPVIMEPGEHRRYEDAPELFFMEQNLFRPMYQKWRKPVSDISITSLKDPRQELSFVAREIVRLVRTKGCRYRDFAVVTGDVPQYANYVPETFAQYGIRFLSTRQETFCFIRLSSLSARRLRLWSLISPTRVCSASFGAVWRDGF